MMNVAHSSTSRPFDGNPYTVTLPSNSSILLDTTSQEAYRKTASSANSRPLNFIAKSFICNSSKF